MNIAIKSIYLFIVASLALTSCTQGDEPGRVDADSRQIVFSTSLSELPDSRTEIMTTDALTYFQVTGFDVDMASDGTLQPVIPYQRIDKVSGQDKYTSSGCLWPEVGKEDHKVAFFAFYPSLDVHSNANLFNSYSGGKLTYKLTGFEVDALIDRQVDFITAYNTGSMAVNQFTGVDLTFKHQLSRIEVKAWSKHKSCDIEIAGVRVGGTNLEGTFYFQNDDNDGFWSDRTNNKPVEYIFGENDAIVSLKSGSSTTSTIGSAVSIMGGLHTNNPNTAMLIPGDYTTPWDYAADSKNEKKGLYLSVLLRVTDAILTAGINPKEKQRYPYKDLTEGKDALATPRVYLAVKKATNVVRCQLYKRGDAYFTDKDCTHGRDIADDEEVKEFGWAAIPVTGNWAPGYVYTYTLNYSHGVGLLDPEVSTTSPGAGDPIISDRVGITYTVDKWRDGGGSQFTVPGS